MTGRPIFRQHHGLGIVSSLLLFTLCSMGFACTDILVTPDASQDSSAMIAYNADDASLFGFVYHYPASSATTSSNTDSTTATTTTSSSSSSLTANPQDNKTPPPRQQMRRIYDWDSGVYLGEILEANQTYHVVGNTNEHGLVIGESTFGGISFLPQTDGILDYGSLIYVTLQRAKTCREAIQTINDLLDTYGYYSAGESFSLMDYSTGEVWMMEIVGRGMTYGKKGAVWVAQRIPNGMVAAHANQARIRTFAREDPDNSLFAPDVVDVAVHYGLYPPDADPLEFSFSDAYCPLDFVSARQGEARVWSIFSQIVDPTEQFQLQYQSYAMGRNLTHRMPLYVKSYQKLSAMDVMKLMTSHYEGTALDSSLDVGAGLFESPYRPRPLVWDWNGTTYHNERSIATAKTGWSFVAQIRPWMPRRLSGLIWFACDDSSTAPRVPIYSASTRIAKPYAGQGPQDGLTSPILKFDMKKAFWVQNMVSNFAYYRWNDVYPLVRQRIEEIQQRFESMVMVADQCALDLYKSSGDEAEAVEYVTKFSVNAGNRLHQQWIEFYGELFARFRDMYTIIPQPDDPACACKAMEPGLSEEMKGRIVKETGDRYKVWGDGDDQPDYSLIRGEEGFRQHGSKFVQPIVNK